MTVQQTLEAAFQAYNAGDLSRAETLCLQILDSHPDHTQILHLLGLVASRAGRFEEAANVLNKALTVTPDDVEVLCSLGNALKNLRRFDDAIICFRDAIALNPDHVAAQYNLGVALHSQGNYQDAATSYRNAIALKPDYAIAYNNLGAALLSLEKPDEAVASYRKAVSINPDYAAAHANLGTALMRQDAHRQAVSSFRRALELNPNLPEALNSLGGCLKSLNNLEEALENYRKSISLMPDNAIFHWNLSFLLLQMGRYREGWQEYEWGFKVEGKRAPLLPVQRWQGEPLRGKTILIYPEQGVGDEILFSACIPDLMEKSPSQIYLECDPRLQGLFKRSFGTPAVQGKSRDIDLSWVGKDVVVDYCLPMGSLPLHFRNQRGDFPDRKSFLIASPELVGKWEKRLTPLGTKPRIGISWRGGKRQVTHRSSIPLARWKTFLSDDISVVNLQYGDVDEEIADFKKTTGITVHDWPDNDPLADLDNLAALITNLDLVISIDNATVHLAGALGTPVWNMMDATVNSMWMENQTDTTPLYRQMRLFRKIGKNDWEDVLVQVEKELRRYLLNR